MVTKVLNWINYRLPIINTFERHLSKHPVPKKVNFWYLFGALASIVLILQIVTGIWLMMPYSNTEEGAFASIEYIMRDVDYGWIIRYMHTTGASMFFAIVYLHMFRGLLYGSYKKPKELDLVELNLSETPDGNKKVTLVSKPETKKKVKVLSKTEIKELIPPR